MSILDILLCSPVIIHLFLLKLRNDTLQTQDAGKRKE